MNEEMLYKIMTFVCMCMCVLAGLAAIVVVVEMSLDFSFGGLIATPLLAAGSGAFGYSSYYFARRASGFTSVFSNAGEKEVLTWKQRQDLRRRRGEVVMEKAIVEIEHEHQNIVHNQIEASKDPDKPPHETQWSRALDRATEKKLRNTPKRAWEESQERY